MPPSGAGLRQVRWRRTHLSLRSTSSVDMGGCLSLLHRGCQTFMGQAWGRAGLSRRPRPVSNAVTKPAASSTPGRSLSDGPLEPSQTS